MPMTRETSPRDANPAVAPADPFAWDPDPVVLVSRRHRALYIPSGVLRGEPTPAQVKAWTDPAALSTARDERHVSLLAGVNFLGAFTSSWLYRLHDGRAAPQGPPPVDSCVLLWPSTNGSDLVTSPRSGNVDRETGRLRPDKVREVVERVLAYHRQHMSGGDENLWAADDGFDAAEFVMMPLSQIFAQASPEAAGAHTTIVQSIRHLRRTREVAAVLGALHDYAVRARNGAAIMAECRAWWTAKKLG